MLLLFIGGPVACAGLVALLVSLRVVKKYEQGVPFRLGRVTGERRAGSTSVVPLVDVPHRVSVRIVTAPVRGPRRARGVGDREYGVRGSGRQALRHRHSASASLRHPTPEKRLFTASDVVGTRE